MKDNVSPCHLYFMEWGMGERNRCARVVQVFGNNTGDIFGG